LKINKSPLILKIVGRNEDRKVYRRLRDQIQQYDLGAYIEFVDWVDGPVKNLLLAEARCVLLPSHYESFGRVVPEAIAARTPVIASKNTPWSSIERLGCGWLDRNPESWAEMIERFGKGPNKIDLDSKECADFLEQFSQKQVSVQWRALFLALNPNKCMETHSA
jgi:glycosyltransferase involved in cell wall biosynthesis